MGVSDNSWFICFHARDNAYLSCGFGIVVVNLKKKEISGTYYIGENGGQVEL